MFGYVVIVETFSCFFLRSSTFKKERNLFLEVRAAAAPAAALDVSVCCWECDSGWARISDECSWTAFIFSSTGCLALWVGSVPAWAGVVNVAANVSFGVILGFLWSDNLSWRPFSELFMLFDERCLKTTDIPIWYVMLFWEKKKGYNTTTFSVHVRVVRKHRNHLFPWLHLNWMPLRPFAWWA